MYDWRTYRSRIAWLLRDGRPADDPDLIEARRDLAAARLIECAKAAAGPHPITDDQRAVVMGILAGAGNAQ